MGRERQKKKNKSSIPKVRLKRKPRRVNPRSNPVIAANWYECLFSTFPEFLNSPLPLLLGNSYESEGESMLSMWLYLTESFELAFLRL